jgi:hypothetical protein
MLHKPGRKTPRQPGTLSVSLVARTTSVPGGQRRNLWSLADPPTFSHAVLLHAVCRWRLPVGRTLSGKGFSACLVKQTCVVTQVAHSSMREPTNGATRPLCFATTAPSTPVQTPSLAPPSSNVLVHLLALRARHLLQVNRALYFQVRFMGSFVGRW